MNDYRHYFGFKKVPFADEMPVKELMQLPDMIAVRQRLDYLMTTGGVMLVTGEVGAGKSTALRWSTSHFHPSSIHIVKVIAQGGSVNELYKQLCWALDIELRSGSRALLIRSIKDALRERLNRKLKVLIMIDEANLLRADVLNEIHTLTQFEQATTEPVALVFCGQVSFIDRITHYQAAPLASRVMGRAHLSAINRSQMREYVEHHLQVSGVKKPLYSEQAIEAIQQGSAGVLRRANHLARGALVAAAHQEKDLVTPEQVRIAASETFM